MVNLKMVGFLHGLFWKSSVFFYSSLMTYSLVTTAKVITEREDDRRSRGFGFVTVDSAENLRLAVEDLNETVSVYLTAIVYLYMIHC